MQPSRTPISSRSSSAVLNTQPFLLTQKCNFFWRYIMATSLPLSELINVQLNVQPLAPSRRDFGVLNLMTPKRDTCLMMRVRFMLNMQPLPLLSKRLAAIVQRPRPHAYSLPKPRARNALWFHVGSALNAFYRQPI